MIKQLMLGGLTLLAGLAMSDATAAAPLSKADAKAAATIKQSIEARYPNARILSVQPSQYLGLYEVFTGDSVSYANATGDLLFVGSIMDTRTKRNLTVERMDELNAIDFKSLPLDRAIKVVKGNGSRQVAVFSDPECPYCQQLEKEFESVTDVTIYTFLFPIASLHPDAPARAEALWCSANPGTAWKEWMVDRKPPAWKSCDGDPVDELKALGEKLGINSTPTMFAANGRRFAGAMPLQDLEKFLNGPRSADARPAQPADRTPTAARN